MFSKHFFYKYSVVTVFLILNLFSVRFLYGQETLKVNRQDRHYSFLGKGAYLSVADQNLNLSQVRNFAADRWQLFEEKTPNFGYQPNKTYWLSFRLDLRADPDSWIFSYDFPITDFLDVYRLKPNGELIEHLELGIGRPLKGKKETAHAAFSFALDAEANPEQLIYMKVQTKAPVILAVALSKDTYFEQKMMTKNVLYGIYFGALLVMLFYNLFVFVSLRDRSYLYYVLSITATLFVFLAVSGYLYKHFTPQATWFNLRAVRIGMGLVVISTSIFSRKFLQTKVYAIWVDRALLGTAFLAIPAILLVITDIQHSATNTLVSVQALLLVVAGVVCWRRGNAYAPFYVLAWVSYALAGIWVSLRNSGVMPIHFFTMYGAEIGSLLEVTLLSLALSDRYRIIRKERQSLLMSNTALLQGQNEKLEKQVNERTAQLSRANQSLLQRNDELHTTLETVEKQKESLLVQQQNLAKIYKNATSSIAYAKRIQDAKLPQKADFLQAFSQMFIFFKPRDVVSGDFYWLGKVDNQTIVAVADSTGHGVPGALMSMIGSEILNDLVIAQGIVRPSEILSKLHEGIRNTLRQRETNNRDGIDISVCTFDSDKKQVCFAGASTSIIYVHHNQFFRLKGNVWEIGGRTYRTPRKYTDHYLAFDAQTAVYMYTDGFPHQFGGPEGKNFTNEAFKNKMFEISKSDIDAQEQLLEKTLYEWQKHCPQSPQKQTDDILVLGFGGHHSPDNRY